MRRRFLAPLLVGLALVTSGCGDSQPDPEPSAPAENIDPTSDNVITGPINRARQTAEDAEERNQQLDQ